ncbi:NACHT domain-containing protein [Bacillus sp. LR_5]|uniref:NACHT domain-containing protein n=1 Tax=Bacillus sp. LR_5 TaxID=3055784 RepID=UPI003653422B
MEQTPIDPSKLIVEVVQKNLETICKRVFDFSKDKVADYQIKTQNAYQEYLNRAAHKYGKVKTLIHKSIPINLYDFYVHTDLECEDTIISTEEINAILQVSNYSMVLGSGGTGKSTLFKHLFISALYTSDKIPIFVPLRNVNDSEQTLIDCMYETINSLGFSLEKKYFLESLDTGIYIFLFDGFDEVEDSKQQKIIKEIEILMNKYHQNSFLVSSRRSDSLSMGWDDFVEFNMLPLSKEKSIQLIEKLPYYDEEVKSRFLKTLDESLYDKHADFCSNPLLLTLMLLTFDEFSEIPDKMHVFYGQAYDVLERRHDATKPGFVRKKKTDVYNLGPDGFSKILETISAISYFENKSSFTSQELRNYINKAKKLERLEFNLEFYSIDLIESVCILILDGLKYTYQHRSFQEYFTARYINRQSEEVQKKLLFGIVDSKRFSINSDQVVKILFDLNRSMVERKLFLPKLKDIREKISKESIHEYISRIVGTCMLNVKIDSDGTTHLRRLLDVSSMDKDYFLLIGIHREYSKVPVYHQMYQNGNQGKHYRKEFQSVDEFISYIELFICGDEINDKRIKHMIKLVKEKHLNLNSEGSNTDYIPININLLFNKGSHETRQEVINMIKQIQNDVNICLKILERLEKEHQEMDVIIDNFF